MDGRGCCGGETGRHGDTESQFEMRERDAKLVESHSGKEAVK